MTEFDFERINRPRNLKENETIIGIKESEKLIGQLYPVLIDEQGTVLDGQHRLQANPEWRKETVKGLDTERKKAMVRLHANWHRRRNHPDQVLRELAKITKWKGASPYAAFLGCSVRTVQRYLPQAYKERQRTPKRQLSLSERKEMPPYEVELLDKITEEEYRNNPETKTLEQIRKGEPSGWDKKSLLDFLGYRIYNNVSKRTEEPETLLNTPEIKEECQFYLTALEQIETPQEEILNYLKAARIVHLVRLKEHTDQQRREKQYREKLDDLYNKVTKLILVLEDGSQIEYDRPNIPKVYTASWNNYDIIKPLLEPHVQQLFGLDKYLRLIKEAQP